MITGATILVPKGISRGAPAWAVSSSKIYCCTEFQPGPPNCLGQPTPPPAPLVQGALPQHMVLAAQFVAVQDLVADLRGELLTETGKSIATFPPRANSAIAPVTR